MKPIAHNLRRRASIRGPRVLVYLDQSNNSGSILQGVQNLGSIQQVSKCPGATISQEWAADLQAENARLRAENSQLLGIVENMAERIQELRQIADGKAAALER